MTLQPKHILLAIALATLPAPAMAQSAQQRSTDEAVNRNVSQALERARQSADRQRQQGVVSPQPEQQGGPRPLSSHYENRIQTPNSQGATRGNPPR